MVYMSEAEMKIAEWVWANPGIGSMKIVKVCGANYGWKKSTVFTLIRRMKEKGLLVNENAALKMTVERSTYYHEYACEFIHSHYQGSLNKFLESYFKETGISKQEAGPIMNTIRKHTLWEKR